METSARYLLLSRSSASACTKDTCPASDSIYGYAPSLDFNIAFVITFMISGFVFYSQALVWKRWRFFSFALAIGCVMEAGGYVGRILLHSDPFSGMGFKLNVILLTIAPASLSAAIYATLGRVIPIFGPQYSRLPSKMYTYIFISSDCISMVLQGAGGAISAVAKSQNLLNLGVDIMIAGLAFQVFTLLIFFGLSMEFMIQCSRNRGSLSTESTKLACCVKFRLFLAAVTTSFLCIFTRCCYRVAELRGGWGNPIMRKEDEFIIMESDMCAVAAIILNIFHPGVFFEQPTMIVVEEEAHLQRRDNVGLMCRNFYRDGSLHGSIEMVYREQYPGGFF